jgi:RNA polymerase sigma-70 factor (ECF subfamily)
MDLIHIRQSQSQIDANDFNLEHSRFIKGNLGHTLFEDICLAKATINNVNGSGLTIINANLSDMEIEGAQLGGAYIHNIGMPPKDHPMYVEGAKMRPVKFEDCQLANSQFKNCDLRGVAITDCNIAGMTINGIAVEELLARR